MTQQINLYQPELYERGVPFSTRQMASVLVAVLLMIITAGAFNYWRISGLNTELSRLQKRQEAAVQRINDYQHNYPPRSADPDLISEVDAMMNTRQAKLALLQSLSDGHLGNRQGLSEHLFGLARQHLSTVWLRRIRISAGGDQLLFEGSSTHAADIPLYLQRLTEQQVFADREFEYLQLSRSENEVPIIDFILKTSLEGAP
jgi:Tfp pilus assembly protein PilN